MYIVRAHSLRKWGGLLPKVLIFWKVQLFPWCGKWKRWRFNSKSLWASSHIWNLAWNLPLNVTRSSQNEWRVLLMVFLLLFTHKPSFTKKRQSRWWFQWLFFFTPIWGRFPIWLLFFRWVETTTQWIFVRWKKTSPCRNRCDEAAKVKALKKLKDGPGSEINSWRPSEDATAEKIIQGKSGKCQKKTKKSTPSGAKELQKKVKWHLSKLRGTLRIPYSLFRRKIPVPNLSCLSFGWNCWHHAYKKSEKLNDLYYLGGGFKYFFFSPLFGEDSYFD